MVVIWLCLLFLIHPKIDQIVSISAMETFVEKVMYNLVLYALTIGEITLTQSLYIESHIHSGLQPTIVLQQ